jgi:hypothetical protein
MPGAPIYVDLLGERYLNSWGAVISVSQKFG